MNTTYTVIKKCLAKGAVERREPKFVCHALISREEAQAESIDELSKKCSADLPKRCLQHC